MTFPESWPESSLNALGSPTSTVHGPEGRPGNRTTPEGTPSATSEDRAHEPLATAQRNYNDCDCVPGHRCDCWDYRQPAPSEGLRDIILNGGLRLPGFDHWRERVSSKPSDPDDIRWDCSCGYSGAPEKVQRHWHALLDKPAPSEGPRAHGATEGYSIPRQPAPSEGLTPRTTVLAWRQCVCEAWYWGAEQTEDDKAHSIARQPAPSEVREREYLTWHVVDFTETGYGLQHPPTCRPDLINCQYNRFLADYGEPLMAPGRYRMLWATDDDMPTFHLLDIIEHLASQPAPSEGLREAARHFLDVYDLTHLVHDVAYESVNDAAAELRTALRLVVRTR